MRFICPKRPYWAYIYKEIKRLPTDVPSPVPPSRHEWPSLSDEQRAFKWKLMFDWLEQWELEILADSIPDEEWHVTDVDYFAPFDAPGQTPYGRDPLL